MKNFLISTLLFFPCIIHAQDTVFQNIENFVVGDTATYLVGSSTNLPVIKVGENVDWDYRKFTEIKDTVYQFIINPDSYSSDFPNANIVEKNSDGSLTFIKKTKKDNQIWGFITSENLKIKYLTPHVLINRPFAYKDSLHSECTRVYETYNQKYEGKGNSITVAEGFGTLHLPNGTFNDVLLIRFEHTYKDISQASMGNTMLIHTISYAWFDKKHKSALLKIDNVSISSQYYNDKSENIQYLVIE